MRVSFVCILCILSLALSGCSRSVVYKEVYLPTNCDVKARVKPVNKGSSALFLKEILIYTQGLEQDLAYCKGEYGK
ncbi:hypothetical protein LS71_002740 [Helicobacter jaachi]|uniref:Lipoprotein n=1 Tax=Helicobacter jaachi TaxID=1677920 RepID=A0A4U8TCK2_9HELI|nr:hypothetical protein [Helicobacter jaachi]TLD97675.1 hypothetical protein LS71_002740 [Helicobacter jaachi]